MCLGIHLSTISQQNESYMAVLHCQLLFLFRLQCDIFTGTHYRQIKYCFSVVVYSAMNKWHKNDLNASVICNQMHLPHLIFFVWTAFPEWSVCLVAPLVLCQFDVEMDDSRNQKKTKKQCEIMVKNYAAAMHFYLVICF